MKRLFEKIKNDCAGAVTVLVTLLLIPAVLISGTGVDLARAYAAKSIVQDANQLAGNSALASYDAMLQDLYGLFAMSVKDEEFAGMVNRYIQTAIFGEEWKDTGPGTFQLFYGSDIQSTEITAAGGQNLDNPDVLRRQIEDYAKYRAPKVMSGDQTYVPMWTVHVEMCSIRILSTTTLKKSTIPKPLCLSRGSRPMRSIFSRCA